MNGTLNETVNQSIARAFACVVYSDRGHRSTYIKCEFFTQDESPEGKLTSHLHRVGKY